MCHNYVSHRLITDRVSFAGCCSYAHYKTAPPAYGAVPAICLYIMATAFHSSPVDVFAKCNTRMAVAQQYSAAYNATAAVLGTLVCLLKCVVLLSCSQC